MDLDRQHYEQSPKEREFFSQTENFRMSITDSREVEANFGPDAIAYTLEEVADNLLKASKDLQKVTFGLSDAKAQFSDGKVLADIAGDASFATGFLGRNQKETQWSVQIEIENQPLGPRVYGRVRNVVQGDIEDIGDMRSLINRNLDQSDLDVALRAALERHLTPRNMDLDDIGLHIVGGELRIGALNLPRVDAQGSKDISEVMNATMERLRANSCGKIVFEAQDFERMLPSIITSTPGSEKVTLSNEKISIANEEGVTPTARIQVDAKLRGEEAKGLAKLASFVSTNVTFGLRNRRSTPGDLETWNLSFGIAEGREELKETRKGMVEGGVNDQIKGFFREQLGDESGNYEISLRITATGKLVVSFEDKKERAERLERWRKGEFGTPTKTSKEVIAESSQPSREELPDWVQALRPVESTIEESVDEVTSEKPDGKKTQSGDLVVDPTDQDTLPMKGLRKKYYDEDIPEDDGVETGGDEKESEDDNEREALLLELAHTLENLETEGADLGKLALRFNRETYEKLWEKSEEGQVSLDTRKLNQEMAIQRTIFSIFRKVHGIDEGGYMSERLFGAPPGKDDPSYDLWKEFEKEFVFLMIRKEVQEADEGTIDETFSKDFMDWFSGAKDQLKSKNEKEEKL